MNIYTPTLRFLCFLIVLLQCGVIECVPDSKSRDQLGKQTQMSLLEYFEIVHGKEDNVKFQLVCGTLLLPPHSPSK